MELDFVIRLAVAGLLGALIGLEREFRAKEAGLRTHFLVAVGAALMMIVSKYGFFDLLSNSHTSFDPSRVAAQVVSGVGFLGAGTIILRRHVVRGAYDGRGDLGYVGHRADDRGRYVCHRHQRHDFGVNRA